MEGWQQRRLGSMGTIWKRRNKEEERKNGKNERKDLTLTGLLMEGLSKPECANEPSNRITSGLPVICPET
jgi:hypothetical protein